jgi:hypothetical protein
VAQLNLRYIRKMEDVLALCEKPYNASEPVVCLDGKPVSLHRELRSPIPAKPSMPDKRDNSSTEYSARIRPFSREKVLRGAAT